MRKDIAAIKTAQAAESMAANLEVITAGITVLNDRLMRLEAALIANGLVIDEDKPALKTAIKK